VDSSVNAKPDRMNYFFRIYLFDRAFNEVVEVFLYDLAAAAASVPFNLIQAAAALIIAVPVTYLLKNVKA